MCERRASVCAPGLTAPALKHRGGGRPGRGWGAVGGTGGTGEGWARAGHLGLGQDDDDAAGKASREGSGGALGLWPPKLAALHLPEPPPGLA